MNLKESIRKASPTILTVLGIFGVVATAYTTAKATEKVIKEKECNLDYSKKDQIKSYIKHYSTPVLFGTGTIICIVGSNKLNKNNQALLVSAYGVLDQTYKEYVNTVKELYGEDKHREVIDKIALSHCEQPFLSTQNYTGDSSLDVGTDEIKHTFYDSFSKRYFESTMSHVLQAEYHLNRNYMLGMEVTVKDWYEFLGLEEVDLGDQFSWWYLNYAGWRMEDGVYWIDFDHHKFTTKSGQDVIVIDFVFAPELEPEE